MNIHCQSKDDDLGNITLKNGDEIEWSFSLNFWGTTLFYCDVQWENLNYHFDVYSNKRDHKRCYSECHWMISDYGSLYGYDQESGKWSSFPLKPIPGTRPTRSTRPIRPENRPTRRRRRSAADLRSQNPRPA
ncbi:hypothetical protein SO802_018795, partial [Lithocarpus litseifolius]